jgi:hypothetical protein
LQNSQLAKGAEGDDRGGSRRRAQNMQPKEAFELFRSLKAAEESAAKVPFRGAAE